MRLTLKNIKFVKKRTMNGVAYGYYVSLGNRVADSRDYYNVDILKRSTGEEYKFSWLPKTVQKYIKLHEPGKVWLDETDEHDNRFVIYIYDGEPV